MMIMRGDTTYVIWQSGSSIRMTAAGSNAETLVGEGRQPKLATLRDGHLLAAWQHNEQIFTRRF